MAAMGIPFQHLVDASEYQQLKENSLNEKLKYICPSESRRTKALAATAYKSELDALQWILSHSDDPLIDEAAERDFFLFLSAHTELEVKISEFWEDSLVNNGWNHAHEYPPHITLLSRLKIRDKDVLAMHAAFDKVMAANADLLDFDKISLKLHVSSDFIGYIVCDNKVNCKLNAFCDAFLREIHSNGIKLDGDYANKRKFTYHMSVAYGFPAVQTTNLIELQETYLPHMWEYDINNLSISLYSWDFRMSAVDSELYKMQTTVIINDNLFSKLSMEKNINGLFEESFTHLISPMTTNPDSSSSSSISLLAESKHVFPPPERHSKSASTPQTLAHNVGDLVLLVGVGNLPGQFGSAIGLNLLTGLTGAFNLAAGRRVAKSNSLVSHRSVGVSCNQANETDISLTVFVAPSRIPSWFHGSLEAARLKNDVGSTNADAAFSKAVIIQTNGKQRNCSNSSACSSISMNSKTPPSGGSTPSPPCSNSFLASSRYFLSGIWSSVGITSQISNTFEKNGGQRRLFVMRHAERTDLCFGRAWTTRCIDRRGLYHRLNLNMPPRLPTRVDLVDHTLDAPLTQVGLFVASESGRALSESGVRFSACYVSPAFRCIQTACQLLKAAGQTNLLVRVEPLLFEWLGWYASGRLPNFLTSLELADLGYAVDTSYSPLTSPFQFDMHESVSQYYERSAHLVKALLEKHQTKDSNILIVGHASSLDSCTLSLLRKRFRSGSFGGKSNEVEELNRRSAMVPYCGLLLAVEGRRWHLQESLIPSLVHGQNSDFDWRQFHGSFGVK